MKPFFMGLITAAESMTAEQFIDHLRETVAREEIPRLYDLMDHQYLEDRLAEAQAEGVLKGAEYALNKIPEE